MSHVPVSSHCRCGCRLDFSPVPPPIRAASCFQQWLERLVQAGERGARLSSSVLAATTITNHSLQRQEAVQFNLLESGWLPMQGWPGVFPSVCWPPLLLRPPPRLLGEEKFVRPGEVFPQDMVAVGQFLLFPRGFPPRDLASRSVVA